MHDYAEFLSPNSVARMMDWNPQTVYRLCREGRLPRYRVGKRSIRIPRAAVLKLISETEARIPAGQPYVSRLSLHEEHPR